MSRTVNNTIFSISQHLFDIYATLIVQPQMKELPVSYLLTYLRDHFLLTRVLRAEIDAQRRG